MLYIPSRLPVFLVLKNYELSFLSCNSTFSHANFSKDVIFSRYYYFSTKLIYDKSRNFTNTVVGYCQQLFVDIGLPLSVIA
jgi:hypothetical protein